ncbi:MAG: hypothetical protein ACK5WZ_10450 [Pseudobdellovibrionaceae bacterium]|jgi:hypothetical protein
MKKWIFLPFLSLVLACQEGQQFALEEQSQVFDQSAVYNNKVDVVFMVDDSSSMMDHQNRLANTIPTLIQKLLSLKLDMHFAVVNSNMGGNTNGKSADGGKFLGSPRYLTNSTPNLAATLAARIKVGEGGSNNERGMESLVTALSAPYIINEGMGFLRQEAYLVVIALTDEEDYSPVPGGSSQALNYYKNFFDQLKPQTLPGVKNWVMNVIGKLSLSTSCSSFSESGSISEPFISLATYSSGIKTSLCTSDLTGAVANINARLIEIITDYRLNKIPNVSTIRVLMNGVSVPQSTVNGWDYIPSVNAIRFYGSFIPKADANIKIDFTPDAPN